MHRRSRRECIAVAPRHFAVFRWRTAHTYRVLLAIHGFLNSASFHNRRPALGIGRRALARINDYYPGEERRVPVRLPRAPRYSVAAYTRNCTRVGSDNGFVFAVEVKGEKFWSRSEILREMLFLLFTFSPISSILNRKKLESLVSIRTIVQLEGRKLRI